tara:strand:+ start:480 stop:626 length:147 start_codon:yes stop_codon:yes gene_type:complete
VINAIDKDKEFEKYLFQYNFSFSKYVREKLIKTPQSPEIENFKKINTD